MDKMIERIKKTTGNSCDIIYKEIFVNKKKINIIYSETLSSSSFISEYIVKSFIKLNTNNIDFCITNINSLLSGINKVQLYSFNEVIDYLYKSFCIIICDDFLMAIEARNNLDRGIPNSEVEVSILGPKDSFNERFNDNVGLIRKRLRTSELYVDNLEVGLSSKTKIGICYMNNIVNKDLLFNIKNKIDDIDIDGVIDTSYIRKYLSKSKIFPTVFITERPDIASQALLEGKVIIVVDNSPFVLILPTFFIDFFHTPDDYYEKNINISFVRILRLLAFFIAIFLPGIYISLTTHNIDVVPSLLLHNLISQRLSVPFPSFVECIILLIAFEILRETDLRIPSKMGSSISILGGLILGEAAVSAGIVSPIMIIVVAISSISGLIFSNISIIYLIRYLRLFCVILGTFFGLYGIFLSFVLLIIKLASLDSFGYPYTYPLAPISSVDLSDSLIKYDTNPKYRNSLLSKRNLVRGRKNEK
ncbi:MAG: spore germination protein [Bacilli bacterium]|nr:spore germination protein [Bacilli bacterium]